MADKELEDFILHLNREAMNYLKQENFQLSLKTLKDAEKLLKTLNSPENLKLHGITLNNFGCFYKRINKPNVALKFLQRACEKESIEPIDRVNLSGTLLNMCAIYSQLGKHDRALEQGIQALSLLEQETMTSPNLASTLIIAYHNTGVEYEYLSNLRQAVECYKSAWTFAMKQMGENNNLTVSIHKTYVDALEKLEKTESRSTAREQLRLTHKIKPQERRNQTAFPAIRQNKDSNPYVKPKANPAVPQKPAKKPEKSVLEKAAVLNQVRFLTGDRLQPMFQNKTQSITLKPVTVSKTVESSLGPVRAKHTRDKNIDLTETTNDFNEKSHVRTSSAPVNINVGNLQERIRNLESKYEDFDKKIQPFKNNLPELDSFKMQNITALYEMEKIAELDNKRKKIEEEKEKFLQNVKRMEAIEAKLKEERPDEQEKEESEQELAEEDKEQMSPEEETPEHQFPSIDDQEPEAKDEPGPKLESKAQTPKPSNPQVVKTPLTTTQGYFRGYLSRRSLDKRTLAAIIIQKHVRRYLCRVIYLDIKQAIITIQRSYRLYRTRKNHQFKL